MVVAIISVLAAVAIMNVNKDPAVRDVAQKLSNILRETSRRAVAGGPVRSDVITATGVTARTRARITFQNGAQRVLIEELKEDTLPANGAQWETSRSTWIDRSVEIYGTRASAETVAGLGPQTVLGTSDYSILCYPNGSCDPVTIYLQTKKQAKKARTVVMPLNGSPLYFSQW